MTGIHASTVDDAQYELPCFLAISFPILKPSYIVLKERRSNWALPVDHSGWEPNVVATRAWAEPWAYERQGLFTLARESRTQTFTHLSSNAESWVRLVLLHRSNDRPNPELLSYIRRREKYFAIHLNQNPLSSSKSLTSEKPSLSEVSHTWQYSNELKVFLTARGQFSRVIQCLFGRKSFFMTQNSRSVLFGSPNFGSWIGNGSRRPLSTYPRRL